jgi:DNA adenine methylase
MKNPAAFKTFFGGKAGSGTYQTLINHIPPHKLYCSFFLGNDAVFRHIKPAEYCLLVDIDKQIIDAWKDVFIPDYKHALRNADALDNLRNIEMTLNQFASFDFNLEDVFIFLDPPYLFSSRKSNRPVYKHEMGDKESHVALLELITDRKFDGYNIMICSYPNSLYEMYLNDWDHVDFYSRIRGGVALERIYTNYKISSLNELHDYRYLGGNFREREKFKRISVNLMKKLDRLDPVLKNSIIADIVSQLSNS